MYQGGAGFVDSRFRKGLLIDIGFWKKGGFQQYACFDYDKGKELGTVWIWLHRRDKKYDGHKTRWVRTVYDAGQYMTYGILVGVYKLLILDSMLS